MNSAQVRKLAEGTRHALRAEVAGRLDAVVAIGSRESLEHPDSVKLILRDIDEIGREKVIEKAAYTWFNRLCALRFMDANGYTTTQVVTPRPGSTQPAILSDAAKGVYDNEYAFSDKVKKRVSGLLSGEVASHNAREEAYAELIAAVCESYSKPMPYLFKEEVASNLLMPKGLLSEGSILDRIVSQLDEEACSSVEVLGWLYQFYIAERKDEVFASFKNKAKAGAEEIAPATQLFTPEWIVRYLVENSVGRLWMQNNPESDLESRMQFFVKPDDSDQDFIHIDSAEELTVCDPACGSGHILVYAFDLLFAMYEEEGWMIEDIPEKILSNNLFGFEIDERAAEIASFALEMKARSKDPHFFEKNIDANILVLEPVVFSEGDLLGAGEISGQHELIGAFKQLDEIGSLFTPGKDDIPYIDEAIHALSERTDMFTGHTVLQLGKMKAITTALSKKYSVVVANPPYMNTSTLKPSVKNWMFEHYPNEKSDLCTCFINRGFKLLLPNGYNSMVTMQSWMFLDSYEKLRREIVQNRGIITMAHLGTRAFAAIGGEVVSTTAAVFSGSNETERGVYFRLVDFQNEDDKKQSLREAINGPATIRFEPRISSFKAIGGWPIAYWASDSIEKAFAEGLPFDGDTKKGVLTGKNETFLRLWHEVSSDKTDHGCVKAEDITARGNKWFPVTSGGRARKWYGNLDTVVNLENNGADIKRTVKNYRLRDPKYYFKEAITWTEVGGNSLSCRYVPEGVLFGNGGPVCFYPNGNLLEGLAFLNSSVAMSLLGFIAPTINFGPEQIGKLPVFKADDVKETAARCIELSRADWDSFEESWGFEEHPLVRISRNLRNPAYAEQALLRYCADAKRPTSKIETAFHIWEGECTERFLELKSNEESINEAFARIYHMESEVECSVSPDKVSVREADKSRDIKSLLSYAIGCIFGRYSLDSKGLVLASQGSSIGEYMDAIPHATILPDDDNVLPVLEAEWFEDDIVSGVYTWLALAFGEDSFDANIEFIEKCLGKDLRTYLMNDFYSDHLKIYQKRPIYWLFQSPKKSFQCLVYLHRYNESLLGDILTKYLRPYQEKLRAQMSVLSQSDRVKDVKEAARLQSVIEELEQWERDVVYPLAHERVAIDLDDGVKVNYNKFPKALAKVQGLSEWK